MKLPSTQKGNRGRARTKTLLPRSDEVAEGELDSALLDTLEVELDA